ncbi:hypothetical protein MKQ70_32385 [Chitinophaga sedimenti]|uniref:hypothetical protein n=1 Tax=Chitinophaga sedimenti TaxID=2033606 RepID=UPI002004EE5D|nr:hypothetical protein [Chitinophaga sedimenti]MCK7559416.1 hypothetical protein [Chitinophaga sedimenti]
MLIRKDAFVLPQQYSVELKGYHLDGGFVGDDGFSLPIKTERHLFLRPIIAGLTLATIPGHLFDKELAIEKNAQYYWEHGSFGHFGADRPPLGVILLNTPTSPSEILPPPPRDVSSWAIRYTCTC